MFSITGTVFCQHLSDLPVEFTDDAVLVVIDPRSHQSVPLLYQACQVVIQALFQPRAPRAAQFPTCNLSAVLVLFLFLLP